MISMYFTGFAIVFDFFFGFNAFQWFSTALPWISMVFNGLQWFPMVFNRLQWCSMDSMVFRFSVDVNGFQWISLVFFNE